MKKLLFTLLLAVGNLTAWAGYGWYDGSITIGGSTTVCTEWSTDGNNPTDLGIVTNMTVTSVAFKVWSDANDRSGANMYFRIWDGGSQVGVDQNLWIGDAGDASFSFIEGSIHDYSTSWTGTFNLASKVGLTPEPGKTYYVDMYAKTYGTSGDEWYSNNSNNFHAKLTIATDNKITLADNADNTSVIEEYDRTRTNVTLSGRTLQPSGWNTFCVPFSTSIPSGWTVKKLTSSSLSDDVLTLDFDDASSIEAGKPYLVKVTSTVAAPTFNGVTIVSGTTTTPTDFADFVPVMSPTNLEGGDKSVLFVSGGNSLTYPTSTGDINAFRAYFQLHDASSAKAFNMSFEEDDATSIQNSQFIIHNEDDAIYNLAGQRLQKKQKGINIMNGKKVIIK